MIKETGIIFKNVIELDWNKANIKYLNLLIKKKFGEVLLCDQ